eukprot:2502637-Pyramimonas_sp.AAC.1
MPRWVFGTHADDGTEAFSGVPYRATKFWIGWVKMPQWVFQDACGRSHWGLRWSSLWGHETLHWVGENATLGVRDACGR